MSVFSYFWENPLIKVNKKEENFDPIQLGDSVFDTNNDCEDGFSTYDNVLLSGSEFTSNNLMSKEKKLLDQFKTNYQNHDHSQNCKLSDDEEEDICGEENCDYIWGCLEFNEDGVALDKNGDVIDRYHCVHFHKNEMERFKHLRRAKKIIQDCKSWKSIVKQLKKLKKLKKLIGLNPN